MKKQFKLMAMLFISGALALSSCGDDEDKKEEADDMMMDTTTTMTEPTLYEKVGGEEMVADPSNEGMMIEAGRLALRSVVDSTIFVIAGDDELKPYFAVLLAEVTAGDLSGFTALSKDLTDFFAVATGSKNFTYGGLDMVEAHDPSKNNRMTGMADDAAFDAFIADLVVGAKKNNVPDAIIGEIGALVETLRAPVVQK